MSQYRCIVCDSEIVFHYEDEKKMRIYNGICPDCDSIYSANEIKKGDYYWILEDMAGYDNLLKYFKKLKRKISRLEKK